ncbi:EF-hand domain-containing protein [Terriglobus albidus]|uniref:EF-hand domain-containing protein n=1 Tax=Terriglobus albidus TaxID=1592106 RepID=UPI0021DFBACF|nr:EF-hand domain-containing protein [Terriglobus albidus]
MRRALPLSLFVLPFAVLAQGPGGPVGPGGGPGGPPPRIVLQALDTDHDGQLSLAEIAAASAGLLSLDVNHDGQLTSLEYLPNQADPKANNADEMAQRLMVFDKNRDGVLTKDEVPERMAGIFTRADKNGDGKITDDELKSTAAKTAGPNGRVERGANITRMDPILSALDADHDGIISAAEIAAAPAALKTLDKDGDGTLSAAEIRMRQQTPADRAAHFFEEWDTNKDGKVTIEEAPERMGPQFNQIDTNHDGGIDLQEATTYFANMPQQQRGPRPEGQRSDVPRN